jgi:hypothetical protein
MLTEFVSQAPEIQTMYSVPHPVSAIRSRMRQEFERHRFVNKLPVVDVLLFQSAADYQVSTLLLGWRCDGERRGLWTINDGCLAGP